MIRILKTEDFNQSLDLSQAAFANEFTDTEIERQKVQFEPKNILGFFLDRHPDRLAAKVAILPMQIYLNGRHFSMGGIANVSCYPELRRQGMVGKLMIRSLEVMRERGQIVSMLNPFSYQFYRKYGWESFSEVHAITLKPTTLPLFPETEGTVERYKTGDYRVLNEECPIHDLYDAFAARYNGMLHRSREWWNQQVFRRKSGNIALYRDKEGDPRGYAIYRIRDRVMKIMEMAWLDHSARYGLWKFINNHDSLVHEISYIAPEDERMICNLQEPNIQQNRIAHFMIRIVDLKAFLKQYSFTSMPASERVFHLHVRDKYASWNEGTWRLEADDSGRMNVTSLADHRRTDGLSGDIQSISAMLAGHLRPQDLYAAGRLNGASEEIERWERFIPRRTAFISDMF